MQQQIRRFTAAISARKIILRLFETLLGVLFSNIILTRGIMPFGVAYATVASPFGFIGAFVGYLVSGRDTLRLLTACFMARVFRVSLRSFAEINRPLAFFLFTLWGTMLGGLAGFFTADYYPAENLAFMLNGLISGGLAWLFTTALSAYSVRPAGSGALRYFCCVMSFASVLMGFMKLGGIWNGAAKTALLFLLFCVGARCTYFYTVATAAGICAVLCLFLPNEILFFLTVFFGVLLSAVFRLLGRWGQVVSTGVVLTVLWFVSGKSFSLFAEGMRLGVSGLGYLVLPSRWLSRMTDAVIPVGSPLKNRPKKYHLPVWFRKGESKNEKFRESVCRTCPRRWLCLTKYRAETESALAQLRRSPDLQAEALSSGFFRRCIRFPELVAALRQDRKTVYSLKYAKAFAQKKGEVFCGDTASGFRTAEGKYVFTVTDGMGTGTAAARQSVKASRMMESLTESGLSEEDVIKVINRSLVSDREETVVGIDVATVDLKSGVCETFKAGAAPTYVLRGGIAYEIGSETLPVGILEQADIHRNRCTLTDGDYLILISDGVLGADKKWLAEYLNQMVPPDDCVSLADDILREARRRKRNIEDDVTVLAVQMRRIAEAA